MTERVISGAQPEGEESFKTLEALGVKTIITVDGARPNVELARKYGMGYVHLPIGYDGVDPDEGRAIAKAINEMPGPVYLHCHHGKHRSAAAVAVACVYNGTLKPSQAEAVLQTFGTGQNYIGLWAAARDAKPLDPAELRNLKVEFVETAKIADFAERMVEVDRHWDHVKLIQAAGWRTPPDHPDLDPAHEVLQVQEHLHESGRLKNSVARPHEFRKRLVESEDGAKALHGLLQARPVDQDAANTAFKNVAASCVSCHKAYRD
ncbi:MAG: cytochrome c [Tepidisphaeraceae bacterium]